MPKIPGFLPSTSGFHFANSFASVPILYIPVPGRGNIPIGDASNGLCGGMVFAVRDYFEACMPIPRETKSPSSGTLFDYIILRLITSFNLPFGPLAYLRLMDPTLPDSVRASTMINDAWPKIKTDLDSGRLSPIGLIEIQSSDPNDLGSNHQVLAYGYDLNGTNLTIYVYDPNHPDTDNVTMSLSIADPLSATPVTYSTGETVFCFVRHEYTYYDPPRAYYWGQLDNNPATVGIVASGDHLYQLHNNGNIFRFICPPFTGWEQLDNNPATIAIAASGDHLYQLHNNGEIFRFTGPPITGWEKLDNNPVTIAIAASGDHLYQLHNNGEIFRFTGPPITGWEKLDNNPATTAIVASGDHLYQLHNDGEIFRFTGPPITGWEKLDNNPATTAVVACGDRLFQLHNNGNIWRYTGPPITGWEQLDNNPATVSIVASGDHLYQLHNNGEIFRYIGPPMTGWEKLDDNLSTASIVASGDYLYQLDKSGDIWRFKVVP